MSDDPKQNAKEARKHPEVERLLRQFLNHDGPAGASKKFREGWDRIFGSKKDAEECETEEGE